MELGQLIWLIDFIMWMVQRQNYFGEELPRMRMAPICLWLELGLMQSLKGWILAALIRRRTNLIFLREMIFVHLVQQILLSLAVILMVRSEERRVGKEYKF